MPRVVKQEDFYWLQTATPNEVRRKLASRELTVNDTESNGYSVLHVRQSLYNYQLGIHDPSSQTVLWRLSIEQSDTALSIVALLTEHSAPADWEFNGR